MGRKFFFFGEKEEVINTSNGLLLFHQYSSEGKKVVSVLYFLEQRIITNFSSVSLFLCEENSG
jgi:hypothetical protein